MQKSGQHYFSNSIGGAYTQGSGSVVVGTVFEHVLTGIAGMESYAAHVLIGSNGGGSITTQNQGETIPIIASLFLNDPDISNIGGNPDTITATAALYIAGIASEGTDDYAIFVDAGNTRLDGALMVGNPTGGMKGTGTVNAQALYDDNSFLSDWVFEEYYEKGMELTRN